MTDKNKAQVAKETIREGKILHKRGKYETAAKKFEKAGHWAALESLDKKLVNKAFKLMISSWISAFKFDSAFRFLDNLTHKESLGLLKKSLKLIRKAVRGLIRTNNFLLAREQLYRAIYKYQREALLHEVQIITRWQTDNLRSR